MTDKVKIVLEFLKLNGTITDLEKDIWDTADKLVKQPFPKRSFPSPQVPTLIGNRTKIIRIQHLQLCFINAILQHI